MDTGPGALELPKHPAAKLLVKTTGEDLLHVAEHAIKYRDSLPIELQHLYCNWSSMRCFKPLYFDGGGVMQNGEKCLDFRCHDCRGVQAYREFQIAHNMNVIQEANSWLRVPAFMLNKGYLINEAQKLVIPDEPVYRSMEIDDGHSRYSKLVEMSRDDAFRYYARGFDPRVK